MESDNTNPIAPNANGSVDFTNLNGTSDNGLSMADSMASAEESLTSAGMAVDMQNNAIGIDQLGGDSAYGIAPTTEPLTPAAPVPGSIGSATSGPAIPTPAESDQIQFGTANPQPDMSAEQTFAPAATSIDAVNQFSPVDTISPADAIASIDTTAQAETITPVDTPVEPATFGNPFAQPATDGTVPQAAPVAPAAPAAPSIRSKGGFDFSGFFDTKTIITCAVAALLFVTTIIFSSMYLNAKNKPRIEYVDRTPAPVVSTISCATSGDYGYLANYEEGKEASGSRSLVLSFSNDNLTGYGESYVINYDNNTDATLAGGILTSERTSYFRDLGLDFTVSSDVDDNTLTATADGSDATIARNQALELIYGEDKLARSLYAEDVETYLENSGFVCSAE